MVAIIAVAVILFATSAIPVVQLPESLTGIASSTPITVRIGAPHGVRELSAYLEQNGARFALSQQKEISGR